MELPNDLIKATNYSKAKEREIHAFEYVNGKYIHRYVLGGEHEMTPQEIVDCLNAIATIDCDLSTAYAYIKGQDEKIAELKQKAIVPKFRTYQPIFYITQYYTSTKGNPEYDIISDKYYVAENENEIILGWNYAKDFNQRKYYYVRKDWVFATKDEAEQRLAEIGEKDD